MSRTGIEKTEGNEIAFVGLGGIGWGAARAVSWDEESGISAVNLIANKHPGETADNEKKRTNGLVRDFSDGIGVSYPESKDLPAVNCYTSLSDIESEPPAFIAVCANAIKTSDLSSVPIENIREAMTYYNAGILKDVAEYVIDNYIAKGKEPPLVAFMTNPTDVMATAYVKLISSAAKEYGYDIEAASKTIACGALLDQQRVKRKFTEELEVPANSVAGVTAIGPHGPGMGTPLGNVRITTRQAVKLELTPRENGEGVELLFKPGEPEARENPYWLISDFYEARYGVGVGKKKLEETCKSAKKEGPDICAAIGTNATNGPISELVKIIRTCFAALKGREHDYMNKAQGGSKTLCIPGHDGIVSSQPAYVDAGGVHPIARPLRYSEEDIKDSLISQDEHTVALKNLLVNYAESKKDNPFSVVEGIEEEIKEHISEAKKNNSRYACRIIDYFSEYIREDENLRIANTKTDGDADLLARYTMLNIGLERFNCTIFPSKEGFVFSFNHNGDTPNDFKDAVLNHFNEDKYLLEDRGGGKYTLKGVDENDEVLAKVPAGIIDAIENKISLYDSYVELNNKLKSYNCRISSEGGGCFTDSASIIFDIEGATPPDFKKMIANCSGGEIDAENKCRVGKISGRLIDSLNDNISSYLKPSNRVNILQRFMSALCIPRVDEGNPEKVASETENAPSFVSKVLKGHGNRIVTGSPDPEDNQSLSLSSETTGGSPCACYHENSALRRGFSSTPTERSASEPAPGRR